MQNIFPVIAAVYSFHATIARKIVSIIRSIAVKPLYTYDSSIAARPTIGLKAKPPGHARPSQAPGTPRRKVRATGAAGVPEADRVRSKSAVPTRPESRASFGGYEVFDMA